MTTEEVYEEDFLELQQEYLGDIPDLLDSVEAHLIKIEEGDDVVLSLKEIFRTIHSLKGAAGSYEIHWISTACHIFEDKIVAIKDKESPCWIDEIPIFLKILDLMRTYVASFADSCIDKGMFDHRLEQIRNSSFPGLMRDELETVSDVKIFPKKVLIVETAKTITSGYKKIVHDQNMNFSIVKSGKEAFDRLLHEKFDYLITGHYTGIIDGKSLIALTKVVSCASQNICTIFTSSSNTLVFDDFQKPDYFLEKEVGMMNSLKSILSGEGSTYLGVKTPYRVLCIDDDETIHKLLQLSLKKHPEINCHYVFNLAEAENALQDFSPDVILLDYHLDSANGVDLYQTLVGVLGFEGRVIFFTGECKELDKKKMLDIGAIGILSKPFSPKTLYRKLMALVNS